MRRLEPLFAIMPVALFVYGLVVTIAGLYEVRVTAASIGPSFGALHEERMLRITAVIRSMGDLFYYWGLAALIAAVRGRFGEEA